MNSNLYTNINIFYNKYKKEILKNNLHFDFNFLGKIIIKIYSIIYSFFSLIYKVENYTIGHLCDYLTA
jgi:hypothetical protein